MGVISYTWRIEGSTRGHFLGLQWTKRNRWRWKLENWKMLSYRFKLIVIVFLPKAIKILLWPSFTIINSDFFGVKQKFRNFLRTLLNLLILKTRNQFVSSTKWFSIIFRLDPTNIQSWMALKICSNSMLQILRMGSGNRFLVRSHNRYRPKVDATLTVSYSSLGRVEKNRRKKRVHLWTFSPVDKFRVLACIG